MKAYPEIEQAWHLLKNSQVSVFNASHYAALVEISKEVGLPPPNMNCSACFSADIKKLMTKYEQLKQQENGST